MNKRQTSHATCRRKRVLVSMEISFVLVYLIESHIAMVDREDRSGTKLTLINHLGLFHLTDCDWISKRRLPRHWRDRSIWPARNSLELESKNSSACLVDLAVASMKTHRSLLSTVVRSHSFDEKLEEWSIFFPVSFYLWMSQQASCRWMQMNG